MKIFKAIKTKFDFEVPVMVIDLEEFNNIVIENPFLYYTSKNQEYFHLTFLSGKPNQIYVDKINDNHAFHEEFILRDNECIFIVRKVTVNLNLQIAFLKLNSRLKHPHETGKQSLSCKA